MIADREVPAGIKILRASAKRSGTPTHMLGLVYLRALNGELRADVERAHEKYMGIADGEGDLTPGEYEEMQFWGRCFVRFFFLYVDGILYAMRQIVLEAATEGYVSLNQREVASMMEQAYDSKSQRILDKTQSLRPLDAIKKTTRLFIRAFDGSFEPKFQGHGWDCFRDANDLRKTVVHPTATGDLYPSGKSMMAFMKGAQWYALLMADIVGTCAASLDDNEDGQ